MKAIPSDGRIVLLDIPDKITIAEADELMHLLWAAIVDLTAKEHDDE